MKYDLVFKALVLCFLVPLGTQAQHLTRLIDQVPKESAEAVGLEIRHVSDWLLDLPEAKSTMEEFRARRAAGLLPRGRKRMGDIGDRKVFKVLNFVHGALEEIEFELRAIDEIEPQQFQIWVEVAEYESRRVTDAAVDSLLNGLGYETPIGSWKPNAGAIEIDEQIFGEPPDVDGDGVTDILMLDIRDGWDGTANLGVVIGFVLPIDLSASIGNGSDIIYLDTYPTRRLGPQILESTTAHEYQHLIMLNWDLEEIKFIDEGLSEWAELVLGYSSRQMLYLFEHDSYNVSLLDFNEEDSSNDRQRGQLLMSYIGDRFGVLNAGEITRSPLPGARGLRDAMVNMQAGISLEELIFDFHVANGVNDTDIDPRYGYTTPVHKGLRATPSPVFDGRIESETPITRITVQEGGVRYLRWTSVEDFSLTLSPSSSGENPDLSSDNLRAELFFFGDGDRFAGRSPVDISGDTVKIDGFMNRVLLLLVNVEPTGGEGVADLAASWSGSNVPGAYLVTIKYDNGQVRADAIFGLEDGPLGRTSTRFVNPDPQKDTQLDRVWLAHSYLSQFPPRDESAPRDFALQIWGLGEGGGPGSVLFRKDMTDTRAFKPATTALDFMEIDMTPFAPAIGPLPDTIYVGIGESGHDQNFQAVTLSEYSAENQSFIYSSVSQAWVRMWDVQLASGTALEGSVIPTRAQFLVRESTAVVGVQLVHNVAGVDVDVYLDGDLLHDDWTFQSATAFSNLTSGSHRLDVVSATVMDNANPLASLDFDFEEETSNQIIAYGNAEDVQLVAVEGVRTEVGATNMASFYLAHGAKDVGAVTLRLLDPNNSNMLHAILEENMGFGDIGDYHGIEPRKFNAEIAMVGNTTPIDVYSFDFGGLGGESFTLAISGPGTSADEGLTLMGVLPSGEVRLPEIVTARETGADIPKTFALLGNYPNPFNPSTKIAFDLPAAAHVTVEVIDMLGRTVMVVPTHDLEAGAHRSIEVSSKGLASGAYLYRLTAIMETQTTVQSGWMTLVR